MVIIVIYNFTNIKILIMLSKEHGNSINIQVYK